MVAADVLLSKTKKHLEARFPSLSTFCHTIRVLYSKELYFERATFLQMNTQSHSRETEFALEREQSFYLDRSKLTSSHSHSHSQTHSNLPSSAFPQKLTF